MSELIKTVLDPRPEEVSEDPLAFLAWLAGPTEIRLSGRDSSRCRVVSALLHGNEPSSVVAVQRWLGAGGRPAVDTRIFVMAVDAALSGAGFCRRMPPGRRDLNRCFAPPFTGTDGALAREMLARVRGRPVEALVDLHNNTGKNPAYGIINRPGPAHLKLVELFSDACCVLSDLKVGALTEAVVDEMACAAIECGHAEDPAAHDVALAGLERFLTAHDLRLEQELDAPVVLYEHPLRVRLRPGQSVAFGRAPHDLAEVTLRSDIDGFNFRPVARGTVLGWLRAGAAWPLDARGADGREVSREHFELRGTEIVHNSELVPIMMTTNAQVAMVDCLCYLMRPRPGSELAA